MSFFSRSKSSNSLSNSPAKAEGSSSQSRDSAIGPDTVADNDPSTHGSSKLPSSTPTTPNRSPEREVRPTSASAGRKGGSNFLGMRSRTSSQASLKSLTNAELLSSSSPKKPRTPSSGSGPAADENAQELPTELTGQRWKPRPGHPGNLSPEQTQMLISLTGLLSQDNTLPDEGMFSAEQLEVPLCRFLRARNWSVQGAREMWNKSVAFKSNADIEKLLVEFDFTERDQVAKAGWQMYFHKTDKLGRPLFVQDLANLDTNALWTCTTPDRIQKNFVVTLENAVRYRYHFCTEADPQGRLIEDNLMIIDVNGLGMSTFWNFRTQLQQLLAVLDTNFPELSGRVQIINAPWLFSTIWSYVKGWLPPGTVGKIDIQGADYKGSLLQFVEPQNLPKRLGGACECEHAGGCAVSDEGPWKGKLHRRSKQQ